MTRQKQKFQKIFESTTKNKAIHEAVLLIENGSGDLSFAAGYGKKGIHTPFLIASITKLFTSACIFILQEQGRLSLNDPLGKYLSADVMRQLHLYRGRDYSDQLAIHHLLSQTSGLRDAVEEGSQASKKRGMPADQYVSFQEELAGAKKKGAIFAPGEGSKAHYTNINFDLLGEIIEHIMGMDLASVYQQFIFNPLGLKQTYLPISEADFIPSVYYRNQQLNRPKRILSIRASGGCISTAAELMIFLKAFFQGKLFKSERLDVENIDNRLQMTMTPIRYRLGYMKLALGGFSTLFMGKGELIGHSGSTGSFAFYHPASDLFFVGDVNQMANPAIPIRLAMRLAMAVK